MSYVVEELQILDSLRDSKKVSKSDKLFLDRLRAYAISTIQEKRLIEKKENLEGVLFNILELINNKIQELEVRAQTEFDQFLVEKIELKIQELKVLRQRIVLDNKVHLDKMIQEADTTKEGEKILVDVLATLSKNTQEFVTPEAVNYITVDKLFRRIFAGINIGEAMDRTAALDVEEASIAKEMHEQLNINRILGLSIEHYSVIERYLDRIREQLSYETEIDDLRLKRDETHKQLGKLQRRRWKFNSTKKKIRTLSRRLDSIKDVLSQKEQLHDIAIEHVSNTQNTMKKIGIGDLAYELRSLNLRFNPETNVIECPDLESYKKGISVVGMSSAYEIALAILEQTNRNYVREEESTEILTVMKEATMVKLSEIRGSLEVNRAKKNKIEDELVAKITAYLHRISVVNGQLTISDVELAKYPKTSFVAVFALKTLIDLRKDLAIEELPEDLLIEAEVEKLENWFREYADTVYTKAVQSINDLENDKDYSINK